MTMVERVRMGVIVLLCLIPLANADEASDRKKKLDQGMVMSVLVNRLKQHPEQISALRELNRTIGQARGQEKPVVTTQLKREWLAMASANAAQLAQLAKGVRDVKIGGSARDILSAGMGLGKEAAGAPKAQGHAALIDSMARVTFVTADLLIGPTARADAQRFYADGLHLVEHRARAEVFEYFRANGEDLDTLVGWSASLLDLDLRQDAQALWDAEFGKDSRDRAQESLDSIQRRLGNIEMYFEELFVNTQDMRAKLNSMAPGENGSLATAPSQPVAPPSVSAAPTMSEDKPADPRIEWEKQRATARSGMRLGFTVLALDHPEGEIGLTMLDSIDALEDLIEKQAAGLSSMEFLSQGAGLYLGLMNAVSSLKAGEAQARMTQKILEQIQALQQLMVRIYNSLDNRILEVYAGLSRQITLLRQDAQFSYADLLTSVRDSRGASRQSFDDLSNRLRLAGFEQRKPMVDFCVQFRSRFPGQPLPQDKLIDCLIHFAQIATLDGRSTSFLPSPGLSAPMDERAWIAELSVSLQNTSGLRAALDDSNAHFVHLHESLRSVNTGFNAPVVVPSVWSFGSDLYLAFLREHEDRLSANGRIGSYDPRPDVEQLLRAARTLTDSRQMLWSAQREPSILPHAAAVIKESTARLSDLLSGPVQQAISTFPGHPRALAEWDPTRPFGDRQDLQLDLTHRIRVAPKKYESSAPLLVPREMISKLDPLLSLGRAVGMYGWGAGIRCGPGRLDGAPIEQVGNGILVRSEEALAFAEKNTRVEIVVSGRVFNDLQKQEIDAWPYQLTQVFTINALDGFPQEIYPRAVKAYRGRHTFWAIRPTDDAQLSCVKWVYDNWTEGARLSERFSQVTPAALDVSDRPMDRGTTKTRDEVKQQAMGTVEGRYIAIQQEVLQRLNNLKSSELLQRDLTLGGAYEQIIEAFVGLYSDAGNTGPVADLLYHESAMLKRADGLASGVPEVVANDKNTLCGEERGKVRCLQALLVARQEWAARLDDELNKLARASDRVTPSAEVDTLMAELESLAGELQARN